MTGINCLEINEAFGGRSSPGTDLKTTRETSSVSFEHLPAFGILRIMMRGAECCGLRWMDWQESRRLSAVETTYRGRRESDRSRDRHNRPLALIVAAVLNYGGLHSEPSRYQV
jgi:hypothetical protein